jgi:hypothetical protein
MSTSPGQSATATMAAPNGGGVGPSAAGAQSQTVAAPGQAGGQQDATASSQAVGAQGQTVATPGQTVVSPGSAGPTVGVPGGLAPTRVEPGPAGHGPVAVAVAKPGRAKPKTSRWRRLFGSAPASTSTGATAPSPTTQASTPPTQMLPRGEADQPGYHLYRPSSTAEAPPDAGA